MRHVILSAWLLSLAGCATTSAPSSGGALPPVMTTRSNRSAEVRTRAEVARAERIEFPMQAVWDALPGVYAELGVPEVGADPAARTVGNGSFVVSRTLGGEPLSRFVACGTTPVGRPVADEARVQMDVRTVVTAEGGETSMRTTVQATARGNRGTSSDNLACTSTGRLEARIATTLRRKLVS